ncbi:MAG: hypothetical protein Q7S99_03180 [Parvibaculum sp.]|nr:hypothetical protein [Parvibaculum sp.]
MTDTALIAAHDYKIRERAMQAAIDIASMGDTTEDIIKSAASIEAYLRGNTGKPSND